MESKSVIIKIDMDLWKKINKHCSERNKDISEYVEETIIKDLINNM